MRKFCVGAACYALATLCLLGFTSSQAHSDSAKGSPSAAVQSRAQTQATSTGKADFAVVVPDSTRAGHSLIVATTGLGGLEVYAMDGQRLSSTKAGDVAGLAAHDGFKLQGQAITLLATLDSSDNSLQLFRMTGTDIKEIGKRKIPLGFAVEGVCLLHDEMNNSLYAFVLGDGGQIDQHLVFTTRDGHVDTREVRRINVPTTVKQCTAGTGSQIYVVEEEVGVWRFEGNPEADLDATLIDSGNLGHFGKKSKGMTMLNRGTDAGWLFVSDTKGGQINVYNHAEQDRYVGSFTVSAPGAAHKAIAEPGPLFASSAQPGPGFSDGVLLVNDEDGGSNFKLVSVSDIASALRLELPRKSAKAANAKSTTKTVTALIETVPVGSFGDAADDPVIWANPDHPADSLVIATDKKAGMYVYDMQGKVLQFRPDGKMNNTDLRENFELAGKKIILVTASDRTHKAVAIYRLDPHTRRLIDVADGLQATGLKDPYGLCMYQSAKTGNTFVFINSPEGLMRQWQLLGAGNGRVRIKQVREFKMQSQAEGCVANDASGTLYVGEEDVALWRLNAEPDGGDSMTAVDRVADNPAVKDDLEGSGFYDLGDGRGYIVVSSQGNDSYAVYRSWGDHAYLGSFAVIADAESGIDGISETDGLDISSHNLGPGFEHGAMVAQDGRNVMPAENQNYKYVPWESIARALNLEMR